MALQSAELPAKCVAAFEGRFETRDGLTLYERRWEPEGATRGHLVFIHGYGEHCSRYGFMASLYNGLGVAFHAYDQRGHGQSPGRLGYVDDFTRFVDDLDAYLEHIRPRVSGAPLFFLTHSMGGLVLTTYLANASVEPAGVVLGSPFLAFSDAIPSFLLPVGAFIGRVLPWVPFVKMDATGVSRIPEVVEACENDPLGYHGFVHARTASQFHQAIKRARAGFPRITAPLLILHGTADPVVAPSGSTLLFERCASEDKTLQLYDGGYHELWSDLCKDAVISDFLEWIAARM